MNDPLALLLLLCAVVVVFAVLYGLTLLARIARAMDDIQDQMDDMRTRLGVLDPGETRVAEVAPADTRTPAAGNPSRAPDETFPGTGGG